MMEGRVDMDYEERKKEFAIAYDIINNFNVKLFRRIPYDVYDKIEKIAIMYKGKKVYDKSKKLDEQNLPDGTKLILKYVLLNLKNEGAVKKSPTEK